MEKLPDIVLRKAAPLKKILKEIGSTYLEILNIYKDKLSEEHGSVCLS
jgi:hypothetical protein